MADPISAPDPFEPIVEEFLARLRAGERPAVAEYVLRHPAFADRIREQFPSLLMMDQLRPATPPEPPPVSPARLRRFELLQQVGQGAFGAVWRGYDAELRRPVAVKVPRAGLLDDPNVRERFEREARAAAQLRHPGIVSVHELVRLEDGTSALVADFIDGVTLRDMLQAGPMSPRDGATLMLAVAEALDYAHQHKVIHRDVKPGNILVEVQGDSGRTRLRPLVTDFGLALREQEETLTQEGQVLGTPLYMSPEQARGDGHRADHRTDVYSLGAVLYEVLCGEPPFKGDAAAVLMQVQHQEPTRPRKVSSAVPRALEAVCLKCLEKDPARRYATAGEAAADLGRYLRGEPVRARPPGPLGRAAQWVRRKPAATALLAAVVLLAGVGGVGLRYVLQVLAARHEEELASARSFARPLGLLDAAAPLSETELDALWKLAALDNDRVRILFLDEALADPEVADRLARRAAVAVHAAVGLDEGRRQKALKVLRRRAKADSLDPRISRACVEIGLALGDEDSVHAAVAAAVEAMAGADSDSALQAQSARLSMLAEEMNFEDAATAAAAVFTALDNTHNPEVLPVLGRALTRLAERASTEQAPAMTFAGTCAQLLPGEEVQAILQFNDSAPELLRARREYLTSFASRLSPEDAAAAARRTVDWLARPPARDVERMRGNPFPELFLEDLVVLGERMNPDDALAAAQRTLDLLNRAASPGARVAVAHAAYVLAEAPARRGRRSARLSWTAKLTRLRESSLAQVERVESSRRGWKAPDGKDEKPAVLAGEKKQRDEFAALIAELKPGEIAPALEQLLGFLDQVDSHKRQRMADLVVVLAGRLGGDAAAVRRILQSLARVNDPTVLNTLGRAVKGQAARLNPDDAAATARLAVDAIVRADNPAARWTLVDVAAALAGRLQPEQAATIAANAVRRAALAGVESKTLAERLPGRVTPEDAAAAARAAFEEFGDRRWASSTCVTVAALAELGERTRPAGRALAAAAAQLAVDALLQPPPSSGYSDDRVKIAEKAAVLATHLSPAAAESAVTRILDAKNKHPGHSDSAAGVTLTKVLPALAEQMEPAAAEALVRQGLDAILKSDWHPRAGSLGAATAALTGQVRPAEAAALMSLAIDAIRAAPAMTRATRTSTTDKIRATGKIAFALAGRLDPKDAVAAAKQALIAASRTEKGSFEDSDAFAALGTLLAALGARMPPDHIPDGALLTAVGRSMTNQSRGSSEGAVVQDTLRQLAALLANPAKLNDPVAAAEMVRKLIPLIARERGDPTYVKALGVLAPRLRPEDAAAAIRQVHEVVTRVTVNRFYSGEADAPMADAVALLTLRLHPDEVAAAARQAMKTTTTRFQGKVAADLAKAMKPEDAAAALEQVLEPLKRGVDLWYFEPGFEAAAALAKRMKPEEVAAAARRIVLAMPKAPNGRVLYFQAEAVLLLAARLEADARAAVLRSAADQAVQAMSRRPEFAHDVLRSVVPALIRRMSRADAEAVAGAAVSRAVEAVARLGNAVQAARRAHAPPYTASEFAIDDLVKAARAQAVRVNAADADAVTRQGLDAMSRQTDPGLLRFLEDVLAELAGRIKAEDAPALVQRALDGMTRTTDSNALGSLGRTAAALAGRMEPAAGANVVVAAALRALAVEDRANDRLSARPAAREVLEAMKTLTSSEDCRRLGTAVAALAASMEPDAAAALASATGQRLLDVLGDGDRALQFLSGPPRRWEDRGGADWQASEAVRKFAAGIAALADRMKPDDAADLAERTARRLLKALDNEKGKTSSLALGQEVALLSAHLEPSAAAEVAETAARRILDAATNRANGEGKFDHHDLLQVMAGLTERLPPPKSGAIARATVQRLLQTSGDQMRFRNLAFGDPLAARAYQDAYREALSLLASRLDSGDAAAAVQAALDSPSQARPGEDFDRRSVIAEVLIGRCTSQGLADLLKQPTCVGERRRMILRDWSDRHAQPAGNIWEFVARARRHEPDLDLKAPPRPFPKENRP